MKKGINIFKKEKKQEESPPKLKEKEEVMAEASQEKEDKQQKKKKPSKKNDVYKMKKNNGRVIMRYMLWIMLICIFLKGAWDIVKPDSVSEVNNIVRQFRADLKKTGDSPEEVQRFAQDFTKEYLTYEYRGAADFKARIGPYVTKRIQDQAENIYGFRNRAKAVYVNAYRKELYAENQWDVFVSAEIEYEITYPETGEKEIKTEKANIKVPVVYSPGSGYCVESLPLFVKDQRLAGSYNPPEVIVDSEIPTESIRPSIQTFLEAYYSQEQQMINYLISADADKGKFIGMSKRFEFVSISSLKAYAPEGKDILCVVKIKVKDSVNAEELSQELNLTVIQDKDKIYIKDINPRVVSIK
jgi:hypothetical protein